MRKRREVTENNILLFKGNVVRITKELNQQLFFEIRNDVTTDLAEAVSILMKLDVNVWDIEINNKSEIDPEKCLYWLSGGDKEWSTLDHYNRPWVECYLDYQEEFGFMIAQIIEKSKTMGDIKGGFVKYLNLPTLYDFAISKGFVK